MRVIRYSKKKGDLDTIASDLIGDLSSFLIVY